MARQIRMGAAYVFGGNPTTEDGSGNGMEFLGLTGAITINIEGEIATATSAQTGRAAIAVVGLTPSVTIDVPFIDWDKDKLVKYLKGTELVTSAAALGGSTRKAIGFGSQDCVSNSKFTLALVPIKCSTADYPTNLEYDEDTWWFPNAHGIITGGIEIVSPTGDDAARKLPVTFTAVLTPIDQEDNPIPSKFQIAFLGSAAAMWTATTGDGGAGLVTTEWRLPLTSNLQSLISG